MDFHDPISSLSHLMMAGWTMLAAIVVLRLAARHTRTQRLSLIIYAAAVISLYTASGLFHGLRHETLEARRMWQLIDQTAIFGLIFGSNVPLLVYAVPPRVRNRVLALMGTITLIGVVSLWALPKPPHELLVAVYVGMGVLGLLPIRYYFARLGWPGMKWVALLAFFYITGAVFEAAKWPVILPGWLTYHEVLHLFDMAGTVAHYALLLRVVTATPPATPAVRTGPGRRGDPFPGWPHHRTTGGGV
jgi:hemolysin III